MAIITNIMSRGAQAISSLSGGLSINEDSGELVIRRDSKIILKLDATGFKYYDANENLRISIGQNNSSQQQIVVYDADGTARVLVGQNPSGGSPIIAVSKDGTDVLTELRS